MKYLVSGLFTSSILLSLSAGISGIIWIYYNGTYIKTSQFAFYLSICFISTFVSSIYLFIKHSNKFTISQYSESVNNIACLCSFIITLLWVAASICISLLTKDCLNIKTLNADVCSGATVNIVLSFVSLFIWFAILWISIKRLLDSYKWVPALEAQASQYN
jgi:hypothetical protein